MLRHYYTLSVVAREMARLRGCYLTECFTQDKDTLMFCFEDASQRNPEPIFLECSLDIQYGCLFLRNTFHRARKNTVDVFSVLIGQTVREVRVAANERIVSLVLGEGVHQVTLHCIMFGGKQAAGFESGGNVLSVSASGVITNAFKSPETLVNTTFNIAAPNVKPLAAFPPETSLLATLSQCDILLGKYYAREVIHRLLQVINGSFTGDKASLSEWLQHCILSNIEREAQSLRAEAIQSLRFFIYRDEQGKPFLSLLALKTFGTSEQEFTSLSEAIRVCAGLRQKEQTFFAASASIQGRLEQMRDKAVRALQHLDIDSKSGERALERQLFAELLLSQPNVNTKGLAEIALQTWDGDNVRIPLQPALSLRENAEQYFAKARTAKEAKLMREKRCRQYQEQRDKATQGLERLREANDIHSLERITKTIMVETGLKLSPNGQSGGNSHSHTQKQQPAKKFRQFDLGDGYVLYVGKAAADNDELTVHFAKPQDYWFHARGAAGSHAVLKSPVKDKKPPKHIVEGAAAIAAYFSKSRNAKLTPVAYTQKKHIRKPKGSAPGAVVLDREDVVMVKPSIPNGSEE